MLQPKNNGWSYSKGTRAGAWHLLFDDDKNVIEFFESTSTTSTTINLFVGTREECEEFILGNGLVLDTGTASEQIDSETV
jgi:hypothetical protein